MSHTRWAGVFNSNERQKGPVLQRAGFGITAVAVLLGAGAMALFVRADWGVGGRYVKIESPAAATVTVDGDLLGADTLVADDRVSVVVHSVLLAPGTHRVSAALETVEISDDVAVPDESRPEQQWIVIGAERDVLWLEVRWVER